MPCLASALLLLHTDKRFFLLRHPVVSEHLSHLKGCFMNSKKITGIALTVLSFIGGYSIASYPNNTSKQSGEPCSKHFSPREIAALIGGTSLLFLIAGIATLPSPGTHYVHDSKTWVCPNCGSSNQQDFSYCPYCGERYTSFQSHTQCNLTGFSIPVI